MKVIWSPRALERVVEMGESIAQDNPGAAAKLVDALFGSVKRLARFPESGRQVPGFDRRELREVIHGNFRVLYRIDPGQVVVLTVRHSRQDLRPGDPDLP